MTVDGASFTLPGFGSAPAAPTTCWPPTRPSVPARAAPRAAPLVFLATSTGADVQVGGPGLAARRTAAALPEDTTTPGGHGRHRGDRIGCSGVAGFNTDHSGRARPPRARSPTPAAARQAATVSYDLTVPDWISGPGRHRRADTPDQDTASGAAGGQPEDLRVRGAARCLLHGDLGDAARRRRDRLAQPPAASGRGVVLAQPACTSSAWRCATPPPRPPGLTAQPSRLRPGRRGPARSSRRSRTLTPPPSRDHLGRPDGPDRSCPRTSARRPARRGPDPAVRSRVPGRGRHRAAGDRRRHRSPRGMPARYPAQAPVAADLRRRSLGDNPRGRRRLQRPAGPAVRVDVTAGSTCWSACGSRTRRLPELPVNTCASGAATWFGPHRRPPRTRPANTTGTPFTGTGSSTFGAVPGPHRPGRDHARGDAPAG